MSLKRVGECPRVSNSSFKIGAGEKEVDLGIALMARYAY
jgi:hypothetical protein